MSLAEKAREVCDEIGVAEHRDDWPFEQCSSCAAILAALEDVREECAKVAEKNPRGELSTDRARHEIAAIIRALP